MAFKVFLIALFIGVTVCEGSQLCPPREDIPGCSCMKREYGLKLRCVGKYTGKTIEDYSKIFQESNSLARTKLEITFDHFKKGSSLPSNVFEGLNITRLYFLDTLISRWADEEGGPAFVALKDTLEVLTLQSALHKVHKGPHQKDKAVMSLGHLRKLREVHFWHNSMDSFGADWFGNGSTSVEHLSIELSSLSVIGDKAFAGLVNLKSIDIRYNKISEVTRSMFPNPANYLEELYLHGNMLTALPEDIFSNMPALADVNLQSNRITRIPENVWRPVWSSLEWLDLDHNKLNCDEHMEWIFKVRRPAKFYGECSEPLEKKGMDLRLLIDQRQRKDD